jgi:hypothetical protein
MRKIDSLIFQYIDDRLKSNGFAQDAIRRKDARNVMIEAAKVCVGIREKTGKNDGPLVESIQKVAGGSKGHAWCMYFVQTCIAYAEKVTGVKSPLHNGGHCLTLWNKTPAAQRVKIFPLPGAIPIWRHGKTTNGHTEILLGADTKVMQCVGGNTSGADGTGKVTREGNGVFYTTRFMQGFPDVKTASGMILLGFLKPF